MEEDSDDLLSVDEMPDIPLGTGEDEDEDVPSEDEETSRKRKRRDDQKDKRKKRKALPLLASAEDYAALIDAADEENL
jgi:ribosome biogenesis protein MAK21